jgi:hypothetical protein
MPASISRLSQAVLRQEQGDKIARLVAPSRYNKPIKVRDLLTRHRRMPRITGNSKTLRVKPPLPAVIPLFDVSKALHRDLEQLPLLSSWARFSPLLWISGATPFLHYDGWDNILVQLAGRKHVTIYAPEQNHKIELKGIFPANQHNGKAVGEVESKLVYYEGWLEPGEALVIPCGAMHALSGSPDSLSLNCFLDGGPMPKFIRYRYVYFLKLWWPERLSMMVSQKTADWFAMRLGVDFFIRHKRTMSAIPRNFPTTRGMVLE